MDCALKALPRVGTVSGKIVDADPGAPIASASVELVASLPRSLSVSTHAFGGFHFDSNPLLEQIADTLARAPNVTPREIQGHTDAVGSPGRQQVALGSAPDRSRRT